MRSAAFYRIRGALARCEPASPAYTTPPWPGTVVELEDVQGRRYVFQLVADNVRTDAETPCAPSLRSFTDDTPGVTVRDCHPGQRGAAALWSIHRRHLGPTEVREYRTSGESPLDGLPDP